MLLIGALGGLLIYQSEESLMISEHTRLLRTAEYLSSDYYRRIHLFFNVVRNKITQGDLNAIREGFDFDPDFHSVIVLDMRGEVLETYCRNKCDPQSLRLDAHQKQLITPLLQKKQQRKGAVYYTKQESTILLSHAFVHGDRVYLINAVAETFFNRLKYYIQRKTFRSISIINHEGIYIYDSRDPALAETEQSFFDEGAYAAAVEGKEPYTVIEYPAHYKKGDDIWQGLFDEDNFLSYAHISDFDWIVTVWDHGDALDSYLQQVLIAAMILLAATMLLTIFSANMMARNIITPVEKLIKSINAFARGKPMEEDNESYTTYPIFENLLNSFNIMRSRITAREEKLREQIEENARMQDQLVQQEKLAAMGEMIGNIAHQWRQPLSVISTLSTGLQAEQELGLATEDRVMDVCTQINDNAQYLSGTIDDFRQFIKGEHKKVEFKASDLIKSLVSLMKGQLKRHDIDIDIFTEENLVIHGYRNDLLQVLINLIGNAKDALLENREDNRLIRIAIRSGREKRVEIQVLDNGGGIDPEIIHRIFEPYFTTKHKSQGTGLGLHMVHRLVVEGMEGKIDVRTISFSYRENEYAGVEFTVILPHEPAVENKE